MAMLKTILVLFLVLSITLALEATKIKKENIITYDALRVNHAWGCSPKHPQFCQKTQANPYTKVWPYA
ncbi:protein RALF-like 9 [Eutrema salsugineum]|uniref:protein RALF-like 9 n=1 Tax=Eutrema salsugineum TaxID=72664 RepID=UPI000CED0527|nr:protein RALF-like 9 [Eutrema salsugineum]